MKIIFIFLFCIFILLIGISLYGLPLKTVSVVPFINNGDISFEKLCDYIPSYIIFLLKDLTGYAVPSLQSIKEEMKRQRKSIYDLKDRETLVSISEALHSDFIIGGFFNNEAGNVYVSCTIYKVSGGRMSLDNPIISLPVYSADLITVSNAFDRLIPVIEDYVRFDFDPGYITVKTDRECTLYVDGIQCGKTPLRLPLAEGDHSVRIAYPVPAGEETVYDKSVFVKKGERVEVDVPVFRRLSIDAGEKCHVFIGNEEQGCTPFEAELYSGRDYCVRVVYRGSDGAACEVYNGTISSSKDIPPLYFANTGFIEIDVPPPFKARIGSTIETTERSAKIYDLVPGAYDVKIALLDEKETREWIFFEKTIKLAPFGLVTVDPGSLDWKPDIGFALIPSAAQFHNREPLKGWLILTGAIVSAAAIGYSAIQWAYCSSEVTRLEGVAPYSGWIEEINNAYRGSNMYGVLFLGSCAIFAGIYSYSAIDGILTMNKLESVLLGHDIQE